MGDPIANIRNRALTLLKSRHLEEFWAIEEELAAEVGVVLPQRRVVGEAKVRKELEALIQKHPELAKELVQKETTHD